MGITAGWTAAHTGLPSFDVTGPCTVTSGGRVVSVVGDERRLFSDAGAAPGPNVYRDGETSVTVDRVVGVAWDAIFTDSRGRGIPGLIYENNNDPVSWKPNVDQFNRRIARWDLEIPPETGAGNLFLTDPSLEADVWRICKLGVHMFLGPPSRSRVSPCAQSSLAMWGGHGSASLAKSDSRSHGPNSSQHPIVRRW